MPENTNDPDSHSEEGAGESQIKEASQTEIENSPAANGVEEELQLTEPSILTNPEPTVMEVHKHPHHVNEKKSWGEYILEFAMIFFAVFLGFIAENVREHYVERHRAKEYAQSLYNDLKKDSAGLRSIIDFKQWRNGKLDSLIATLKQPDYQKYAKELYYYGCFSTMVDLTFKPFDITIQQLRNSGSLRYFNSVQLYNTITQYYNDCNFYNEREGDNRQFIPPITLTSQLFNAEELMLMFNKFIPADPRDAIRWPTEKQEFKLLSTYGQTWNEFTLYVRKQRYRNELPIMLLQGMIRKDQAELMAGLRREYGVE